MPAGRRGSPVRSGAPGPASIISQGNFAGVDQGVDFRGRGPVPAVDDAVVTDVGESSIVEGGTYPFVIYRLLRGPKAGRRVYVAENIKPTVSVGQQVREGEPVAKARGEYPYIEEGWNATDTGWQPSAPYHGHGATAQGRDFWNYLRTKMRGGSQPIGQNRETLERLWTDAGGPPNAARVMAAIAVAESGGKVNAKHRDSNGTTDYGLWQINSSHGYNVHSLLTDPAYNAKAAVAVYRSQGFGAWSTYTGGQYLSHLGQDPTVPVKGRARPARPGASGSGPASSSSGGGGDTATDEQQAADTEAAKAAKLAWAGYVMEGDPSSSPASGPGAQPAFFGIPGTPNIPGVPNDVPIPGLPGVGFNPFSIFNDAQAAVHDLNTFLKWVAWLFHPRNVLRVVEFTSGAALMFVGLRFLLEGLKASDGGGSTPAKPSGVASRTIKRTVQAGVLAVPGAGEVGLARAAQKGRSQARRARQTGRLQAQRDAQKRRTKLAAKQARQPGESRAEHKARRRGDDVPF